MSNRSKYKSSIGFTDLLFNMVIGFVYLFMIAFILINPIAKKGDVVKKADYIIVIEWDEEFDDDVDLWIKDPSGKTVSFVQKSAGAMNLEKDDLGFSNDIIVRNGIEELVEINREVVTLRGTVPGQYQIAAHIYNRRPFGITTTGRIRLQVIQINPYVEVYNNFYEYNQTGQEISLVNIVINDDGKISGTNNLPSDIITRKRAESYNFVPNYPDFVNPEPSTGNRRGIIL